MSKQYANYSVNDFDKFDCLKISRLCYVVILFVMRAYIVWLISLTNFQDRTSFIAFVYPEKQVFYLNLISGLVGILLIVVMSLRRPEASAWIKSIWPRYRQLMVAALLFDLIVNVIAYFYWDLTSVTWLVGQSLLTLYLIYKSLTSKRLALNLAEFPEPLPEYVKPKERRKPHP
ncbi:DUF2919 domain-containing protein [Thalassotalea sp. LPB0316]|uniref:DUF2919 family protein n=1 Tax=Thalassotalea sp. LPB0316 TaxID=2769490 RepID=UPI0018693295|nr:DUF2919 family protein [Thalassotalea sp. LPB0316]QOL25203.1 DUF2919 domain-containing protein [Thalassotalea sp. LPB0316]